LGLPDKSVRCVPTAFARDTDAKSPVTADPDRDGSESSGTPATR